jgi:hypothetical protein
MQQDIIIITAAGRKTWLREKLTPSAWIRMFGEGVMGGYKEKMEVLRRVDDAIFEWLKDLHKFSKEMRRAAKAARYIDVAILLSKINGRLQAVKDTAPSVKKLTEEETLPFELHHKEELPSGALFADDSDDEMVSQANFSNWMGKTDWGRNWIAKRLENQVRADRRKAVDELVTRTEQVVSNVQAKLEELSKARAAGNIGAYVSALNDISREQAAFKSFFEPIYKKNLEPLVQKAMEAKQEADKLEKQKAEEEADTKSLVEKTVKEMNEPKTPQHQSVQKNVTNAPNVKLPDAPRRVKGPGDLLKAPEGITAPDPIVPATVVDEPIIPPEGHKPEAFVGPGQVVHDIPEPNPKAFQTAKPFEQSPIYEQPWEIDQETLKTNVPPVKKIRKRAPPAPEGAGATASSHIKNIILKTSHQDFVNELVKASNSDDPYLLASMLIRYAGMIEDDDLEKSLQLLAVAEGIIDA